MPRLIKKGSTNVTDYVFIVDSTDGSPETGITITTLDLQFVRNGALPAAKVDATALAGAGDAHADNKMIEVDATDQPGLYRVDWPDAAFVTGVSQVICTVKGTGFQPAHKEYQLVDFDPEDTVRLGLTALPNAAAEAAGGLYTRGSGAGQINQQTNGQIDSNLARWLNVAPLALTAQKVAVQILAAGDFVQAAADKVWSSATRTLTALSTALALSVWNVLESAIVTASSIGLKVKNNLDAAVSSRSSHGDPDPSGFIDVAISSRATPAQVATELGTYDGPTRAEATSDKNEIITDLDDIKGTGFVKDTDSLVDIRPETDKIALADAGAGVAGSVIEEVENRAVPADLGYPQKNQAFSNIEFLMVDSTDHVTPETGLSPTGQRSIDGGAFAAVSGTITEVSNGIYQFDALAADMNGDTIMFRFSDAAADDTFVFVKTRT